MNLDPPALSAPALEALEGYDFPGNVRELKNIIERAVIHSRGADIQPEHLQFVSAIPSTPAASPAPSTGGDPEAIPLNLDEAALHVIERALAQTQGNVAAAARLLGTSPHPPHPHLSRAGEGEIGSSARLGDWLLWHGKCSVSRQSVVPRDDM